ncbi:MAG: DEAD/DEAH box helicase family protein [Myxococcales bacterium]|nr:DEAD/DEAH box helicase family protein [Myxococcales bacterium]
MKSQNFEFLRAKRPLLADLGGFAEKYAHPDPQSSLVKQRAFVENAVLAIYDAYRLQLPYSENLNDRLLADEFRQAVPTIVQDKLHTVRKVGNHAAHLKTALPARTALDCLLVLFEIAEWFHIQVDGGARANCPRYVGPTPEPADDTRAKAALEKVRLAEAKHNELLAALEEERKKRAEAEQTAAQTEAQLEALRSAGQKVAATLQFDERTTRRRLIDQMLVETGWDVGVGGTNTEQVKQEVRVSEHPTPSGEGYADYVLYGDDGKPLAVVEAKKTAKDPKLGAEQARIYAMCLEKETGRRPVIFFTNGIDVFLWDDAQGYPWRKVYGLYSKDSLEYLIHQRTNKKALAHVEPNLAIAERLYQLEAVKRIAERFEGKSRKALVVQATGTGKTRVAVSLCDLLMRAGWVKRILFLCDRRELRRQADRVFKEFMPGEPRVVVGSSTSSDRDKRIYLATYPAMMECFDAFDVGFFDLIVADESHRSIYKTFRSLFQYFDALEVGITATPVKFIERNTYKLFGCEEKDPTAHYSYEEAIRARPPHLVPFRVRTFSSQLRERGVKYAQMSAEQREALEEQEEAPELVDYEASELDKNVFNKGTTRSVLRALMEEGIKDATGTRLGKTIVFARSHLHAVHLAEVFQEMYPQYGSTFCRVIDNQETRAEQLIDDFKNAANELTIAVSVDMLDTGIDVPEVVNLVFAKPVKSYVKFWQMIGRGTRLCRDLLGPGDHKTEFLIFDHWSNFWFFEEKYKEAEPTKKASLLQQLFETRLALAECALDKMNEPVFQATVDLLVHDVRATKDAGNLEVRDHWKELETLSERPRIEQLAAATKHDLLSIAAPLMQWRNIRGEEEAYRFDLLMARLELALVKGGPMASEVADLRGRVAEQVELLTKNLGPVKAKADAILSVRSKDFWRDATVAKLEVLRSELRGIMKYQQHVPTSRIAPATYDLPDADFAGKDHIPKLEGLELVEYRSRVESVLRAQFAENPTLKRVKAGKAVRDEELDELARLVLQIDDKANVRHLAGHHPAARLSLLTVFRGLVGLDHEAVDHAFSDFVRTHTRLTSQQLRFLGVLKNYIAQNGGIEIDRLYEQPFTAIHSDSIDGVFARKSEVDALIHILTQFQPKKAATSEAPPPASKTAS